MGRRLSPGRAFAIEQLIGFSLSANQMTLAEMACRLALFYRVLRQSSIG